MLLPLVRSEECCQDEGGAADRAERKPSPTDREEDSFDVTEFEDDERERVREESRVVKGDGASSSSL